MNILKGKIFENKKLRLMIGLNKDFEELEIPSISVIIRSFLIVDRLIHLPIIEPQEDVLNELVDRLGEDEYTLKRDITIKMMMVFHDWTYERSERVYLTERYSNLLVTEPIRRILEVYRQRR